jgi:hypothetical protein
MRSIFTLDIALALVTLLSACPPPAGGNDNCESCIAFGSTWQPEAGECTPNCDLQDISCFEDECPGACAEDECGNCFDQGSCQAASCTWNVAEEESWCAQ